MKVYLLTDECTDTAYFLLEHEEGLTAYLVANAGSTLKPIIHGTDPEEMAERLSRIDSDESVGLERIYQVQQLRIGVPPQGNPKPLPYWMGGLQKPTGGDRS